MTKRWSQNKGHLKVLHYFTNKLKTKFDLRKLLNRKVLLNAFIYVFIYLFFDWIKTKLGGSEKWLNTNIFDWVKAYIFWMTK